MKTIIWRLNRFFLKGPFAYQLFKLYLLSLIVPLAFFPLFYLVEKVFGENNAGPDLSKWFLAIVIAPVVETLLFQHSIFKLLQKNEYTRGKAAVYIIFSALLFGLSHTYSFYYIVAAFAGGLVLAYTYYLYHNAKKAFWTTTCIHSLHNITAVLIFYLGCV
jgi:membrane protease YdiL (CAAX protease family)